MLGCHANELRSLSGRKVRKEPGRIQLPVAPWRHSVTLAVTTHYQRLPFPSPACRLRHTYFPLLSIDEIQAAQA